MKFGFVIPVYNHGSTLDAVIKNLLPYNFPIIVVDDGNDEKNKAFIQDAVNRYPSVTLITHEKNHGKGKAMKSGVHAAYKMGLTHILQLDSDGQHDTLSIPRFIELSEQNPDAVICGIPKYDESAPKERVDGRKYANGYLHVVTFSKEIIDGMIGFRVYPVKPFYKIIRHHIVSNRMAFDIDILVHFCWKGIRIISEPVKIFYPADGISNYNYVKDTIRISVMYTRLSAILLFTFPIVLIRNHIKGRKINGQKSK
ncbi:MAG: glycosyltransferase family 2 protein [Treponema sp.]|nr:glycosyltransferase family 2 protein [Treponema sp.]